MFYSWVIKNDFDNYYQSLRCWVELADILYVVVVVVVMWLKVGS